MLDRILPGRTASRAIRLFTVALAAALVGSLVPLVPGSSAQNRQRAPGRATTGPVSALSTASGWFGGSTPLSVPDFSDDFSGIDLSGLSKAGRERFLHRANTEMCTCGHTGCRRHTLAFCKQVDPGCPRAQRMLESLAEEIVETHPKSPSATGEDTEETAASRRVDLP